MTKEEEKEICIIECKERSMPIFSTDELLINSLYGTAFLYFAAASVWNPTGWVLLVSLIAYYVISFAVLSLYNVSAAIDQGICHYDCACAIS